MTTGPGRRPRRVALPQRRLADPIGPVAGIHGLNCPFDVVPVAEAFWWNPMYRTGPAHSWFRTVMIDAARELAADER